MAQEYENTQLIVDNVQLNGLSANYTDASAVNKLYVVGSVQTALDTAMADTTSKITQEQIDRTTADESLSIRINTEADERKSEVVRVETDYKTSDAMLSDRVDTVVFSLEAETTSRSDADVALGGRVDVVSQNLENAIQSLTTIIADENTRATGVEMVIQSDVTNLQDNKLNRTSPVVEGDLSLSEPHFIYFGSDWRVRSQSNRMQFEYSKPGSGVFKIALPIICPSF
jgi:hypothetical protein